MTEEITAEQTARLLAEAAQDVLETMFFAAVDDEAELSEAELGDKSGAEVRFHGAWSGRLQIRLAAATAEAIAADFLGEEPGELQPLQVDYVLDELVNMVCGAALGRIDSDGLFDLEGPRRISGEEFGLEPGPVFSLVPLDSGPVEICFARTIPT